MNKIGIFGGAFNPVHNGHISLARAASDLLKLKKTLIIPTGHSPHKENARVSFKDRAQMCRIAFADDERFEISDIEERLGGTSYTINTVRALKEIYPKNTEFYLIIGGDMLFGFEQWYRYEALLKECRVVAAARENDCYADMLDYANEIGRIKVLNLPVTEVSSTEIREKISRGESTQGLIPAEVRAYIDERGLYLG